MKSIVRRNGLKEDIYGRDVGEFKYRLVYLKNWVDSLRFVLDN